MEMIEFMNGCFGKHIIPLQNSILQFISTPLDQLLVQKRDEPISTAIPKIMQMISKV